MLARRIFSLWQTNHRGRLTLDLLHLFLTAVSRELKKKKPQQKQISRKAGTSHQW